MLGRFRCLWRWKRFARFAAQNNIGRQHTVEPFWRANNWAQVFVSCHWQFKNSNVRFYVFICVEWLRCICRRCHGECRPKIPKENRWRGTINNWLSQGCWRKQRLWSTSSTKLECESDPTSIWNYLLCRISNQLWFPNLNGTPNWPNRAIHSKRSCRIFARVSTGVAWR